MKRLVIFCLLVCTTVTAQMRHPAGVANTYTLGEADGFPGFNYTGLYHQLPSGKIYARDFFGNFHITGNNFIKRIAGFPVSASYGSYVTQPNGGFLFFNQKHVFVIKNDRVVKTVPFPAFDYIITHIPPGKTQLLIYRQLKDAVEIYKFENYTWVRKNKIKWHYSSPSEKLLAFSIQNHECLIGRETNGKSSLYFLDTVHYTFENKIISNYDPTSFCNHTSIQKNGEVNKRLEQSVFHFISLRTGEPVDSGKLFTHTGGHLRGSSDNHFIFQYKNLYEYAEYDSLQVNPETIIFESNDFLNDAFRNKYYPFLTALMGNKPIRVFPYIKKYPRLYNNEQSNNIFALAQDDAGRIWAGNYQNHLSIITPAAKTKEGFTGYYPGDVVSLPLQQYPFMNASLNYHGNIYFVGETDKGGIIRYNKNGRMSRVKPGVPVGYYLYLSAKGKQIFMPSSGAGGADYPIFYCNVTDLDKPFINWKTLAKENGIPAWGMSTITEDTLGRIWMGHPKKGFAIYDFTTKKGKSYDARLNESPIGFISCLTDYNGTVWMGSDDKGLWYYNDYSKLPEPKSLQQINHPLLNDVKRITAMVLYKNWLALGCYNRVCLLNLDSFYHNKKIVLRYLNPQEAALTGFTEQNTMLVSHTDSTLWFSTSDMLYQWDINRWLHLPTYKVNVNTYLQKDSNEINLLPSATSKLDAGINSFDIVFEYISPDGLPRFTRTALIKEGDSILFTAPGMQSRSSFKNLSSGNYIFYLDVFEQDGTTSHYKYSFIISKYFWQQWWFWVLSSFVFLLPFFLWLNTLRKKAIQQKQISYLNVVTLSNQFRPHFILNALNTIGADLKDKPAAETVISRLGESIDLIFNQSLKNKVSHSLQNEWTLVLNVIEIHRVMYLPDLQLTLPGEDWLKQHNRIEVPAGILEIAVENALLHGLRNKKTAPYLLTIEGTGNDDFIFFTITDNGIGRANAAALSSFRKHGRGTKNLQEIIGILNRYNHYKIEIKYNDAAEQSTGTIVEITIPKEFHYEY